MADHKSCPATPKSEDPKDLGFERRKMVDWLGPAQLARTGIKAMLSAVFGAYADKREVMAALYPGNQAVLSDFTADAETRKATASLRPQPPVDGDYSQQGEIWFDYIADLADGFDPTYTMARLLAEKQLSLSHGGQTWDLPRAQVLVMGGDQVYPTASFDEYWDRLLMPYKAALPCVIDGEPPHLYAVPGNHDWYDGLSNFTRIFCQKGWIGGWKTQQRRSYFAVKLPHGWWLWGIDIQLEGFIDKPQLDFFFHHATHNVEAGDRVILCTAEPSWVFAVTEGPEAFRSLSFFEDRTIREIGKCEPRAVLTGDLHHYVRYESEDGRVQRITAGGGGAYLAPTHDMPARLDLKEGGRPGLEEGSKTVTYTKKSSFPDDNASKGQIPGTIRLPWRSPGFGWLLAILYTLFGWIVQSASKSWPDFPDGSMMDHLRVQPATWDGFVEALKTFGIVLAHSPSSVIFGALILLGLFGFCTAKNTPARWVIGLAHGVAHILLAVLLMWFFSYVNTEYFGLPIDSLPQVAVFVVEMMLLGAFLGGFLVALYLILFCYVGRFHLNEAFSSQRIPHYKNFLRLHVGPDGKLTIYPVGIKKVCTDWKLNPAAKDGQPWFDPGETLRPELIEKPIEVS